MASIFVRPGATGDGSSRDTPLGSIQDAVDAVDPGDVVFLAAGTYEETVDVTKSGTSGARCVLRRDHDDGDDDRAILDGTGNPTTLRFLGSSYWYVVDLHVRNDGGDGGDTSGTTGIAFHNDGGPLGPASGQGCHHIAVYGGSVSEVNRPPIPGGLANPIWIYNQATAGAGGTPIHHIQLVGIDVHDCDTHNFGVAPEDIYEAPLLIAQGAIEDVEIVGCRWDPNRATSYGAEFGINVMEIGGAIGADPPYPNRWVIRHNHFIGGENSIFLQRTIHALLLCNLFENVNTAMAPNAEGGTDPVGGFVWCIGNQTVNSKVAFATGPWTTGWFGNYGVYVTNNLFETDEEADLFSAQVMYVDGDGTTPFPAADGDSMFAYNVVRAPNGILWLPDSPGSTLVRAQNAYLTDGATSFYYGDAWADFSASGDEGSAKYTEATPISRFAALLEHAAPIPNWYSPGLFGAYEPRLFHRAGERRVYAFGEAPESVLRGYDPRVSVTINGGT